LKNVGLVQFVPSHFFMFHPISHFSGVGASDRGFMSATRHRHIEVRYKEADTEASSLWFILKAIRNPHEKTNDEWLNTFAVKC